ncbi:rhamnogalacturonate lyase B-like [Salvia hispanica]|uniref:rhamnogalacturonate lyase B-like n=1 Tax=Salvia hispanica TaxID=49212 RepID=UPI002008FC58|nr:rhamnogalacturonate lyase B-like [Salvia hispanica]
MTGQKSKKFSLNSSFSSNSTPHPVKLHVSPRTVKIYNDIVKLRLINPTGLIKGIAYKDIHNVLEHEFKDHERGYWDIVWTRPEIGKSNFDKLECTEFRIIAQSDEQVEVSFIKKWNVTLGDNVVPLNVDKRYIMLRGDSGFYSYAIYEHLENWPDLDIEESRIAFKLDQSMFNYMAISKQKQRMMPTGAERAAGKVLAYKEAVLITNTTHPILKGQVDDKYQYSCDNKDNHMHGWMGSDPHIGFWVITPSDEVRVGGPMKTDLTSHAGPIALAIFLSNHYMGPHYGIKLRGGEHWKRVFGPVFIYLNSDSGNDHPTLWKDARNQMLKEAKKWPYDFPSSADYPSAKQRGQIHGRLLVYDQCISTHLIKARSAYVGLAPPGDQGSFQDDSKSYQFWTRADKNGFFTIEHVRPGTYNLYAWVPGVIGDFKYEDNIVINSGSKIGIGDIVYNPPRSGPTLWEIGVPDRTAFEFYVPDPHPRLTNKLYINHVEKYRQYGLWDRYTDLYPKKDLIYNINDSDYRKDWFFAHVTRKSGNNKYKPTTWKIQFNLTNIDNVGVYTLRIALACANLANIQVWINELNTSTPHFSTGKIGRDNAIARHGIHGRYWLYGVDIAGSQLVEGKNIIYLKQATGNNPFVGVMYDYIRLEAPSEQHQD